MRNEDGKATVEDVAMVSTCHANASTTLDGLHAEITHGEMTIAFRILSSPSCLHLLRGFAAPAAHMHRFRKLFCGVGTDENSDATAGSYAYLWRSSSLSRGRQKLEAEERLAGHLRIEERSDLETGEEGHGVFPILPREAPSGEEGSKHGREIWYRWAHGLPPFVSSLPPLTAVPWPEVWEPVRGGRTHTRGFLLRLCTCIQHDI